jgi:hypothetical protein
MSLGRLINTGAGFALRSFSSLPLQSDEALLLSLEVDLSLVIHKLKGNKLIRSGDYFRYLSLSLDPRPPLACRQRVELQRPNTRQGLEPRAPL